MSAMTIFFDEVDKLIKEYEDEIRLDDPGFMFALERKFILALERIGYRYIDNFTKEGTIKDDKR